MLFPPDEYPVGAFTAHGSHPALRVRIRPRRLRWGAYHLHAGSGEDRVEPGGELRVPIAEQEPPPVDTLVELHQQVTGLLDDPATGRVGRDTDNVDPAAGQLQEEEHVDRFEEHRV